jgi:hypothetical protein
LIMWNCFTAADPLSISCAAWGYCIAPCAVIRPTRATSRAITIDRGTVLTTWRRWRTGSRREYVIACAGSVLRTPRPTFAIPGQRGTLAGVRDALPHSTSAARRSTGCRARGVPDSERRARGPWEVRATRDPVTHWRAHFLEAECVRSYPPLRRRFAGWVDDRFFCVD